MNLIKALNRPNALNRWFLASSCAVTLGFVPLSTSLASSTATPSFYKTIVGNVEIVALSDGTNQLPAKFFSNTPDADNTQTYATAVNTYLVKMADQLILIDTGNGDRPDQPSLSVKHLETAGYKPEDINVIVLTHFHGDHIGGLLKDGEKRFPKAKVYVPKVEAAHWLSQEKMRVAPEGARASFTKAQQAMAPYHASQQYVEFEVVEGVDTEILPGVKAIAAYGHTPGHTAFVFETGAEKNFMMWGDIVHNLPLQFADPSITIMFDSDKEQAIKTRQAMLERVSQEPIIVSGTHIEFPGIGEVKKKVDGQYEWIVTP